MQEESESATSFKAAHLAALFPLRELCSNMACKSVLAGQYGVAFLKSFVMNYFSGAAPVRHS